MEIAMRHLSSVIVVTLLFAAPAFAQDLPSRKPGLWEMKLALEGRGLPAQQVRQCVDQATDKKMQASFGGLTQDACSKKDIKNVGGTITIDSVCNLGMGTTTSHAVVTGSFDSAYTVKMSSTSTGGLAIPGVKAGGQTNMTIEARRVGDCEAGQKPGDMIMANGMKINVLNMPNIADMMKMIPQAPH
jgi:hypothetical protein